MARRSYPTYVTDYEWELIEPLLPKPPAPESEPECQLNRNPECHILHIT